MSAAELKRIETQRAEVLDRVRALRADRTRATSRKERAPVIEALQSAQQELEQIDEQRRALLRATGNLVVSEHAMLRYVQRVIGISQAELELMVVPEHMRGPAMLADGRHRCGGHTIVVKDGVVRTVVTGEDTD